MNAGLKIRIKKNESGAGSLSCERPDGSVTWQRHSDRNSAFCALHDLTHYAVETTLGCREGFFGLVSSAWDIADFGHPWPKAPLPKQAERVELIIQFLGLERASGEHWTAEEFNSNAAIQSEAQGSDTRADITADELSLIRKTRQDIFDQWAAVAPNRSIHSDFARAHARMLCGVCDPWHLSLAATRAADQRDLVRTRRQSDRAKLGAYAGSHPSDVLCHRRHDTCGLHPRNYQRYFKCRIPGIRQCPARVVLHRLGVPD